MKWEKRCHEFDSYWDEIKNLKKIYIFGAGLTGQTAYDYLHENIHILGFVDNDKDKQNTFINEVPVISPDEVVGSQDVAVIIAVGPESVLEIKRQMDALCVQAYDMYTFIPVFALYSQNELVFTSISFLPTTVCNLNCECCLNFSPYIKRQTFRDVEGLKDDIDIFFNKIDSILLFHISGGEPFLYPDIIGLIRYIHDNYGNRIYRLETTTNGTVIPSDDLCRDLRSMNIGVILDDYTKSLPDKKMVFEEVKSKLLQYGVNYRIQRADSWIDLRPADEDVYSKPEELVDHFNDCAVPWQEYREGKLYLCNYSDYAGVAGINQVMDDEFLDFKGDVSKAEIMEFRLGYSKKGFVGFCKRCPGYSCNEKYVTPAKQIKRG